MKTTGISGIYRILHIRSRRVYIGSSKHISSRWTFHRVQLRKNRHSNRYLQRAWNRYGEAAFSFEIIEATDNLVEREQFWLDETKAAIPRYGFNLRPLAERNSGLSFPYKKRKPKTHCKNGHEFTPENTYYLARGERVCRACDNAKANFSWHRDSGTCPKGHIRTPENTRIAKDGSQNCRDCRRERVRAWRARKAKNNEDSQQ